MTFFNLMDRLVIPAVIAILLVGGVAGVALGCAMVINHTATLAFMRRMNRWVSTREVLAPLDVPINVERASPDGRRPVLGTFLVIGGAIAVYFLLVRLDFQSRTYAPGMDLKRWLFSGIALETMKWVLVAGSAFASIIGALMLLAPHRLAAFERRMNEWHSTEPVVAASEKMHTPLDARVEAYPLATGWIVAGASLLVTVAMSGLLIARIH
ncbi:MAG TPA: hypothetical protein VM183_18395 [Burkholderiales bacterium]|nr:hypothetical protein [Burkholderiales bacterium]